MSWVDRGAGRGLATVRAVDNGIFAPIFCAHLYSPPYSAFCALRGVVEPDFSLTAGP